MGRDFSLLLFIHYAHNLSLCYTLNILSVFPYYENMILSSSINFSSSLYRFYCTLFNLSIILFLQNFSLFFHFYISMFLSDTYFFNLFSLFSSSTHLLFLFHFFLAQPLFFRHPHCFLSYFPELLSRDFPSTYTPLSLPYPLFPCFFGFRNAYFFLIWSFSQLQFFVVFLATFFMSYSKKYSYFESQSLLTALLYLLPSPFLSFRPLKIKICVFW